MIVGHVPDLGRQFEKLRITVAPLRYGAGAKGKVASSLSYGVPCVVTPVAAEGMGLVHGETVMVASDPRQFASYVLHLYDDEDMWNRMSDRATDHMRSRHSLAAGVEHIEAILQTMTANR